MTAYPSIAARSNPGTSTSLGTESASTRPAAIRSGTSSAARGCSCESSQLSAASTVCRWPKPRIRTSSAGPLLVSRMRDRTHVHITLRLFSGCLDERPKGFRQLVKIRRGNKTRGDRRGAVLIQRRSPGRAQQKLKKFDGALFVRGVVHQCNAPCDVGGRNGYGARTPGSPESRQNHNRVLPVPGIT